MNVPDCLCEAQPSCSKGIQIIVISNATSRGSERVGACHHSNQRNTLSLGKIWRRSLSEWRLLQLRLSAISMGLAGSHPFSLRFASWVFAFDPLILLLHRLFLTSLELCELAPNLQSSPIYGTRAEETYLFRPWPLKVSLPGFIHYYCLNFELLVLNLFFFFFSR